MQNDILKLADKTVVIAGPFASYTFDMVSSLSRQGASVVLLTPDEANAKRICQVINDEREINEDYGKAFTLLFNPDKDSPEKIMADAAHTFHGLDIYIDNMNWHESPKEDNSLADFDKSLKRNLDLSTKLTVAALHFLKGRKKGKVIFLIDGAPFSQNLTPAYTVARGGILSLIESYAPELKKFNININGLMLELSEDFLLKHFPGQNFKDSLLALKKESPNIEITRTEVISKFVTLLACDLSQGATGQVFKLNV